MDEKLSRYGQRGVSFSKTEVHNAIKNIDKGLYPNAFCKVIPDVLSGDETKALIIHADGAGTKSSLAYMYWKETGDISVFKGIAQDALVMNIDDILCVAPTRKCLLSSTIGRNAHNIPGEVISTIIEANNELVELYANFGLDIVNCGGETADVGDLVKTIIVDSTVSTQIDRDEIIDFTRVADGQIIVGFASDGQASYEIEYNSGIGSNGLSSARHEIFSSQYTKKYPETFAHETKKEFVYNGKFSLTDELTDIPINMGKAVLSPTRTYAPILLKAFKQFGKKITGIVHCSGGAQTKCLKFGQGIHFIKNNLFPIPPLFKYIQEVANMSWQEMYSVFNMGHRLEIICDEDIAKDLIELSQSFAIKAQIIGYVKKNTGNQNTLELKSTQVEFCL